MKATNKQIAVFREVGQLRLRSIKPDKKTKVDLAVKRQVDKLKSLHESYIDRQQDLKDEHASIDKETKVVLRDEKGNNRYEKSQLKELRKKLRDLDNETQSVDGTFVPESDLPTSLDFDYTGGDGNTYTYSDYDVRTAFTGIVLKPEDEE
jgi:hypothetical protein